VHEIVYIYNLNHDNNSVSERNQIEDMNVR